ncbi:DNA polymerase III subunit beta [Gallaecimonas xiamenensis]|uniref:Beta sliding clamp n=1 Tax=Gallaecimonas xiamenensis 3-C-1 TaxID=745411 RepID=K2KF42_9GAMM|nr:DNA polymerase III subunit beta [Gallaecimonas xiamenensis]EKE75990.1 DNA polymerase III subunit beta [Gallaecimonas xiamenensis 3-C-1]
MKFVINREQLLRPLQQVAGAVERRHTLPILANVLIEVNDGLLSLTGTDLEVELIGQLTLTDASHNGRITVPAKKLVDIIRGLPDGAEIKVDVDGERLLVRSGRSRFSLSTLAAEDYPNIDAWQSDIEFVTAQSSLRKLIDSTHFSMANQDVRYYLNGMLFETEHNKLRTVSTDGHRLAMAYQIIDGVNLPEHQVIVPRKGVLELVRLLNHDDALVKVQIGANHIRVITDDFTFTSKLVDGRFPDYRRVLPRQADNRLQGDREVLRQAFARASILSNEKFRGVRLNLDGSELKITANNPEQEEAEEHLEVDYQGAALEIGFNVSYILDVLNTLKCDRVQLAFGDANSSTLIEDAQSDEAVYVVMPMRL